MDDPRHPTWTVRVTGGPEGPLGANARAHRFAVGDAVSFDEAHAWPTALEHALAAVGAELCGGLRAIARQRRLEVDAVEAVVRGTLDDALAHLGVVGATGSPALARLHIRLYASSPDAEAALREVAAVAEARAPLLQTFRRAGVSVALELKISP